jgi:hypothetical protein
MTTAPDPRYATIFDRTRPPFQSQMYQGQPHQMQYKQYNSFGASPSDGARYSPYNTSAVKHRPRRRDVDDPLLDLIYFLIKIYQLMILAQIAFFCLFLVAMWSIIAFGPAWMRLICHDSVGVVSGVDVR